MDKHFSTVQKRQVVDITNDVAQAVRGKGRGVAVIFVQHTTAAVTAADLDPGTDLDLLDALSHLIPQLPWRHPHNPAHTPDHLLASIIGPSITVPFTNGHLVLGTWQRIVLIEFDGPRDRNVAIRVVAES